MSRLSRPILLGVAGLLFAATPAQAIVGGKTTDRTWPHMAGMEYFADSDEDGDKEWSFRCGGSLVAPDVVLTAAHCVDDTANDGTLVAKDFRFLLGSKLRSSGGERIGVVEIRENPGYNGSDEVGSDVALMKLERASTLGRTIRLAQSADAPRWAPGQQSTIIGWGAEFSNGPSPDALKEATVPIVADNTCATSYMFTLPFDPKTSVCAGETTGGEDSCQGDSGGPLMVQDAMGAWILVGDTSFGFGCAFPTQYGVYGEVGGSTLRQWVEKNVGEMSNAGGLNANPPPLTGTPGATGTPTAPTPAPAPGTAPPSAPPAAAVPPRTLRVTLPARLRGARRIRVRVTSTERLRAVRLTLRSGRRTLASARSSSLSRRRTLTLRARRSVRPGRFVLRLTARDARGQRVTVTRRVRIRR